MFDVSEIRRDFPILKRKVDGQPLIYLDNAVSQKALSDDEEKAARQARSRKGMRRILEHYRDAGLIRFHRLFHASGPHRGRPQTA